MRLADHIFSVHVTLLEGDLRIRRVNRGGGGLSLTGIASCCLLCSSVIMGDSLTADCTLTKEARQILLQANLNKQISCSGLPNDQKRTETQQPYRHTLLSATLVTSRDVADLCACAHLYIYTYNRIYGTTDRPI